MYITKDNVKTIKEAEDIISGLSGLETQKGEAFVKKFKELSGKMERAEILQEARITRNEMRKVYGEKA